MRKSIYRFVVMAVAMVTALTVASAQSVLKVGSTPTGIPFTFLDTKTNTIQGVMVDLITEVGKDAGFQVQVEPMQFSTLIASLTSNKIDLISAAMYITRRASEVIEFSEPVYSYGEGLIVPKADTKEYKAFEDFKGETVGAQVGTAYVEPLKKTGLFADVKIYDTIADIMRDVNTGRLKAGFGDYPILAYNVKQGQFPRSAVGEALQGDDRRLDRHRRAQGRRRAAQEDQRVARQAEGGRHASTRFWRSGACDRRRLSTQDRLPRAPLSASRMAMQRFLDQSVEFMPILLTGVKLTILVTDRLARGLDRARADLGADAGLGHSRCSRRSRERSSTSSAASRSSCSCSTSISCCRISASR